MHQTISWSNISQFNRSLSDTDGTTISTVFVTSRIPYRFQPIVANHLPISSTLMVNVEQRRVAGGQIFRPLFRNLSSDQTDHRVRIHCPRKSFVRAKLNLVQFGTPGNLTGTVRDHDVFADSIGGHHGVMFRLVFLAFRRGDYSSLFVGTHRDPDGFSLTNFLHKDPCAATVNHMFFRSDTPLVFLEYLSYSCEGNQ